MYGLIEEDISKDNLQPIKCPRCGIKNDPAAKFCSGCSLGLDEKSVMEYDSQKDLATETGFNIQSLLENPEFKMQMMNMMAKQWKKMKEE